MKKWIALLLVALMALSCAACTAQQPETPEVPETEGGQNETPDEPETPDAPETDEGSDNAPEAGLPDVTVDNPAAYVSLSVISGETSYMLNAYPDESGACYIEYHGADVVKKGTVDAKYLHNITKAIEDSGFAEMNGTSEYAEGTDYASVYVQYSDDTYLTCDFSGVIPDDFMECYAAVESCFKQITADMAEYVPAPVVADGIDATRKEEALAILNGSGLPNLDGYAVNEPAQDEYYAMSLGMSDTSGIAGGTVIAPMMQPNPFEVVIVTLADGADAEAVRADMEANLGWNKWVCVSADSAAFATKDNMVLCMLGSGDQFELTLAGIVDSGWTVVGQVNNADSDM